MVLVMRIAFLLPVITISGGVKIALTYARELEKSGCSVEVFVLSNHEYDGWFGNLSFPIHHFQDTSKLARSFACYRFDVLVCTFWKTVYAGRLGIIRADKHFYLVQGDEPNFYPDQSVERAAALATYKGREHKIVVSRSLRKRLEEYGVEGEVHVIENGIEPVDDEGGSLLSRGNKPRVLVEGRLGDSLKRTDETLRMLEEIDGLDVIAVTPAYDEPLRPLANLLLRCVPANKMGLVYASVDILVKFSKSEGFALPVVEAMSYGVVPIVTDFGGNRDYIESGSNGIVVAEPTVAGLVEALARCNRKPCSFLRGRASDWCILRVEESI